MGVVEKVAVEAKQPNSGVKSALEFNSRKTTRELPPTFQEMVVCLSLKKMTRFLSLVSVDLDTLRVISRVLDSRSSRLLDAVSVPFGCIRRISLKSENWRAYVFPK